ncbi:penicillin-binding protein, partial [Flavobacterium sp. IR1]
MEDWGRNPRYISSFAGYFPAENPKYSCIVVIHKPNTRTGYYGADVSGPVFKRIAQKIFTDTPVTDKIDSLNITAPEIEQDFEKYFATSRKAKQVMPNLKGMPAMDAISILENLGLQVKIIGNGNVSGQSIKAGENIKPN